MTAGTSSSEGDGQQIPHPTVHAPPVSELPRSWTSFADAALQMELPNEAVATADSGISAACTASTQAAESAQAWRQVKWQFIAVIYAVPFPDASRSSLAHVIDFWHARQGTCVVRKRPPCREVQARQGARAFARPDARREPGEIRAHRGSRRFRGLSSSHDGERGSVCPGYWADRRGTLVG